MRVFHSNNTLEQDVLIIRQLFAHCLPNSRAQMLDHGLQLNPFQRAQHPLQHEISNMYCHNKLKRMLTLIFGWMENYREIDDDVIFKSLSRCYEVGDSYRT
jgi:hypothetical protein